MSENTKIWDALAKTDPAHTKKFSRAGGFRGTSVKPIYTTHKMTEQFGPAGKGWGMSEPVFQVVPAGDQILVYCTVGLWWGQRDQIVYGVGGDIVWGKNKNGAYVDDEAFKKSYTDALSNAMKQIGMSADIHMGQHDDDKYVSALREEFGNGHAEPAKTGAAISGPIGQLGPKEDQVESLALEWFDGSGVKVRTIRGVEAFMRELYEAAPKFPALFASNEHTLAWLEKEYPAAKCGKKTVAAAARAVRLAFDAQGATV